MQQFIGALKELIRGCHFGTKENSMMRDIFTLNMKKEKIRKIIGRKIELEALLSFGVSERVES